MILYFYQKNCHVFIFCLYSMYCIVDHYFYFIWWLLKELFVFLFVWFIRLVPRCIQVRAGFQQPLGWLFVGLVFVPQVEQFGLEVAVLATLDSFEFPVRHKSDLQGSKFGLFVQELN